MGDYEKMILETEKSCNERQRQEYNKIYEKIDKNNERINSVKEHISASNQIQLNMQEKIENIEKMMINFIKSADDKYAPKTTVRAIVRGITTFGTALIIGMATFIFKLLSSGIVN